MYIINRENVEWLVNYYKQAWPFDMVVLDESTSFKNPRSKRFKAIKLVRRFVKKMVLLTGTPSSKGLIDLWAQVYLLDGGVRLGRTLGPIVSNTLTRTSGAGLRFSVIRLKTERRAPCWPPSLIFAFP